MLASNFTFALKKTRASSRNVGKVSFRVSWYSENFPLEGRVRKKCINYCAENKKCILPLLADRIVCEGLVVLSIATVGEFPNHYDCLTMPAGRVQNACLAGPYVYLLIHHD